MASSEFVVQRKPRTWTDTFLRSKQRNKDVRFGTWNVSSLYRLGSFTSASRKLARYKLDLVGAQEVRWDKGGMVREGAYIFFMVKEKKIVNWENNFWYTTE